MKFLIDITCLYYSEKQSQVNIVGKICAKIS
nr:MAG TPA: hypothetical protein [Caudoviricetes sp.]